MSQTYFRSDFFVWQTRSQWTPDYNNTFSTIDRLPTHSSFTLPIATARISN